MIAALIVCGLYLLLVFPVASLLGRSMRDADSEPDWLWDQPTDVLSDEAVDARFAEITAHIKVRS